MTVLDFKDIYTDENAKITEIRLIQAPVIEFNKLSELGVAVQERISLLDLDNMVATEETLKDVKSLRTDLIKEFAEFEERRKLVKELIMKPYNDFNESYEIHISSVYKKADMTLKSKIDKVEIGILKTKVDCLDAYFNSVNPYDFLKLEDIGLKVIKSTPDSAYRKQIDVYLQRIRDDIATINTMPESELIFAKYQLSKDLNKSIADANLEKEQIKKIASRKLVNAPSQNISEHTETKPVTYDLSEAPPDQKVYKTSFLAYGTKEQLLKLKAFMEHEGIRYE